MEFSLVVMLCGHAAGIATWRGVQAGTGWSKPSPGGGATYSSGPVDYIVRRALGEMKLKSEIVRPRVYETLAPNQVYTVHGAAWAGEAEVTGIAVSTDGGQTWAEAEFLDPVQRYAWRRWKFDWRTPKEPGRYTLLARARDANGNVQPEKHDPNHGTYVINHPLPIDVFVDNPTSRSG